MGVRSTGVGLRRACLDPLRHRSSGTPCVADSVRRMKLFPSTHRAPGGGLPALLALLALLIGVFAAAPAEAQTRVLVLADGSTRFSAVSYYNAAISEFAAVVGTTNVQSRNDLDTATLTLADLQRPGGGSYDIIVLVASFNGIGTANWTLLRDAVRTRAARSFVLFSDHCSICSTDNVDGGNGNGMVPLLNTATGWGATIGTLRTAPLPAPLNTGSPLSSSFTGMNPMQTNDYHSMNGVPTNNALYLAPGAAVPPAGTTRIDDVTAVLLSSAESYGGLGACVFAIADVNPLAIPGNPGRVGPAFVNAVTSASGSCAAGPLVITAPASGTITANPRPVISGLAQPGSTVVVTVGGQTLSAVAALDGSWSVTPTALAEGSYTATATRTLGALVQTASTSFSVTVCGNGAIAGAERCDDGNTAPDDGCSATCEVERGSVCRGDRSTCAVTCGDGVRAPAETCDDGNTAAGDGCSATCAIEAGWSCDNPDTTVIYSRRGVSDCVEVPGFEPASSTAVPSRLAVPGVGVWTAYRARYVTGVGLASFHSRARFDPGTGVRAAVFGGFTAAGQTSAALARTVAERVSYDFAVGVADSVRAATPDVASACGNNSDTAITYRIDSMSVCGPACRDTSMTGTDTGCTMAAPHCRSLTGGGARCEACLDSATTGADLGCTTPAPHCVPDAMGRNACVACVGAADCDDSAACTTDACGNGACTHTPVAAGGAGQCATGLVCSGGATGTCVPCVSDAQCSGATSVCDLATSTCRAPVMDAGADVADVPSTDAATDASVATDATDASVATDATDASVQDVPAPLDVATQDLPTAQDVPSAQDVPAKQDVSTARDSSATADAGQTVVAVLGDGCGCAVPGTGARRPSAAGALFALGAALARRRRKRR